MNPHKNSKPLGPADWVLLFLITLGAFIVRFYQLEGTTLSNDELSALARLQFGSLKEVMELGVKPDGHPAGVQIFLYYWTDIFGDSAYLVRLPFAIMGALGVPITFAWVRHWFGNLAALLTATALAFLQFPILYSQLARPYPAGLFFCALAILAWTYIFILKRKNLVWYVLFVLAITACLYIHYFSSLFAGVIYLSGFFFMGKKQLKPYLISGVAIGPLYLPHLPIFFSHIGLGGLLWLGKPGFDFFVNHPFYILNDSWWVVSAILVLLIAGILSAKGGQFSKLQWLALAWYFLPLLVGWLKSYFGMPVLQHSVLVFSMPAFLAFIFSFVKDNGQWRTVFLSSASGVILISDLLLEKDYYHTEHHAQFKPLTEKILSWNHAYGEENIHHIINLNRDYYVKYYLKQLGETTDFLIYRTDHPMQVDTVFQIIDTATREYFSYAVANIADPPVIEDIIKLKYPVKVDSSVHFLSNAELFHSKKAGQKLVPELSLGSISGTSEKDFGGNILFQIEFSDVLEAGVVRLRCQAMLQELSPEIDLIVSAESANGEVYDWNSMKLTEYIDETDKYYDVAWLMKLPEKQNPDDKLKLFIWNRAEKPVFVKDFRADFYNALSRP